jgi:UDP-N-acetylglucosamine acyltransferase
MIHPTAIISPGAVLGNNVKIGPYSIVGEKVILGDNVELKSHVVIDGKTTIGANTIIFPFASIGQAPQDLKYQGEDSEVIIGSDNIIREYVTIQRGTKGDKMRTIIGNNCLLMVGVHIAHDSVVGNNAIFANYASLGGHVEVGDYAIVGGLSAVQQWTKVGSHAIIGGVSALVKDLIPYGLANAERAYLEGLNLVGLNRRGFDKKQSLEASKVVKEIFLGDGENGTIIERLNQAKTKYSENAIIQEIIAFLLTENRKFCGFKQENS